MCGRALIRQSLRDARRSEIWVWLRGSRLRYAVAAVCVLAALLTGCSRDPNVRKQKYLESGQRYFDKGQYREAEIQFENAIQVDARFADAHYKLALAAMKLQQWPTAYQELSTTIQKYSPIQRSKRAEVALCRASGPGQPADPRPPVSMTRRSIWTCSRKNSPTTPTSISRGPTTTPAPMTPRLRWRTCKQALQLDPSRSDSYLNLAMLQMRGQDWDAAEDKFQGSGQTQSQVHECAGLAGELLPDSWAISRGGAGVPASH